MFTRTKRLLDIIRQALLFWRVAKTAQGAVVALYSCLKDGAERRPQRPQSGIEENSFGVGANRFATGGCIS